MDHRITLAIGIVGAALVYDAYVFRKLRNKHDNLRIVTHDMYNEQKYLVDILNRNNIRLNEFDMIALPNLKMIDREV
jgi:hypothetical protein